MVEDAGGGREWVGLQCTALRAKGINAGQERRKWLLSELGGCACAPRELPPGMGHSDKMVFVTVIGTGGKTWGNNS